MRKHYDILLHIILYFGISIGVLAVWFLRYDNLGRFLVIGAMVMYYLVWGLTYHYLKRDLDKKIIAEYLLIGAIGLVAGYLVFIS